MYVHGNNLEQKENHITKYRDPDSRQFLAEIRVRYDARRAANEALIGCPSLKNETNSGQIYERK